MYLSILRLLGFLLFASRGPHDFQGQLHQTVLRKKSGWRLESGQEVSKVCVSLFKRVPISWSYPIKGDIDADWPCDAQSHLLLAQFFATEGDVNASVGT